MCEESGFRAMIVFRCDANDTIGYGHFFRCLSLASAALSQGREVLIATELLTPTMRHYAEVHKTQVWEGVLNAETLRGWQTQWLVVDGYHIEPSVVEDFATEFQVLVIDDLAASPISADILLNPNFASDRLPYCTGAGTHRLLGPAYAPLRPEFLSRAPTGLKNNRLFVCLGGGDNTAMLSQVIEAIPEDLAVVVVPGRSQLADIRPGVEIEHEPTNMADLMITCDTAIVGAGSTVWECLALGLRTGAIKLAQNQDIIARELSSMGYIEWLNPEDDLNTGRVLSFLESGKQAPAPPEWRDGAGALRILEQMDAQTVGLSIRRARAGDVREVWEINNDPEARANAVNRAPIPLDDHTAWFASSLANRARLLWVLPDAADKAVGVVRADVVDTDARISIALAPSARGKGHGQRILGDAIERLRRRADIYSVSAIIRPDNLPSLAIFERLEFHYHRDETLNGERFLYYQLDV